MAKRGSLFARESMPEPKRQDQLQAPKLEPQASARPPSRQGKSAVTFYVDPAAAKQLKRLCVDEDASVQGLMVEALNDLFAKRGLNRIA
jgi:Antitoxin-like ribbon-helix-helix